MSADLYAKAKTIFQDAMGRPSSDRQSFVAGACQGDEELLREVLSLIAASENAGSEFLNKPAVKVCVSCDGTFASETKFCPHCGQVLTDDAKALVGTRLDNLYQIEELLGQGGMGAVYRARHVLLGDTVAIKTLKKELSDNPTFLRRFQREGKAARTFHHPNAVAVHDLRTTPAGLIYMVLEYVEGANLRKALEAHGSFSPAEALEILAPIASVVDAAHAKGVVHRDLKPENVMTARNADGELVVKVLDLGIAKLRETMDGEVTTELTAVGTLLGTPHYMSPEQWGLTPRDGGREVDGRADVYSLAVIAFELVCGRWPFTGKTVNEFYTAHTSEPIPLAHERGDGIPAGFGNAIARAMAKDRADRPSKPGEFIAELRAGLGGDARTSPSEPGSVVSQRATLALQSGTTAVKRSTLTDPGSTSVQQVPGGENPTASPGVAGEDAARSVIRPSARRLAIALLAIAAAVVLAVAYVEMKRSPTAAVAPTAAPPAQPATVEMLSFSVEIRDRGGATTRVSGRDAVGSVDGYRFAFTAAVPGRLAVIGPNRRNIPTLFLSTTGNAPLAAGASFVFPSGDWFHTTGDTASDTVTVVFIPEGDVVPAFAAGQAGRQLSVEEQTDLTAFRSSNGVTPVFDDSLGTVSSGAAARPLAADITIRY